MNIDSNNKIDNDNYFLEDETPKKLSSTIENIVLNIDEIFFNNDFTLLKSLFETN
jgi:hypothetical protein